MNQYIQFRCKCGLCNYNFQDWICHWKYGIPRSDLFLGRWPKLRAIYLFLTTRIEWRK